MKYRTSTCVEEPPSISVGRITGDTHLQEELFDRVTGVAVGGFGECLPGWYNYVEINPGVVDTFGIPVLRIHMYTQDMDESAGEMLEAAGCNNVRTNASPFTAAGRSTKWGSRA